MMADLSSEAIAAATSAQPSSQSAGPTQQLGAALREPQAGTHHAEQHSEQGSVFFEESPKVHSNKDKMSFVFSLRRKENYYGGPVCP